MLDSRNNNSKIAQWITTIIVCAIAITVCLSDKYNTQPIIGLCIVFILLCIIGLSYNSKTIQYFRPLILLCSLAYFGFISDNCNCILFYFQGSILFLSGNSFFWLSFVIILSILLLSVIFGPIWCGWLCWLGALQEFIFKENRWKLLKTEKIQKILHYIQTAALLSLVIWVIVSQYPVLCTYDPFISIFRLRIFNWLGYITIPLLLISSLFIYRPFCRILCPIGWLLYVIQYIPFAAKLTTTDCTNCRKCCHYCKLDAIHNKKINKTCIMCGECKKANCSHIHL